MTMILLCWEEIMRNKKFISLILLISAFGMCQANANLALTDLTAPKAPAYRVGISDVPENRYVEVQQDKANLIEKNIEKQVQANQTDNNDVNYSELSIKRISKEISQDLQYDEQDMVSDLSLLWQGAATQSDTINFALYKLANPDADKPDKSTVKNMLKTIASMSTLVGVGAGNPVLAGASLIGGNVFGIMTQDTKALNYKYSKVTDADMIILIRKVEDLQQNTVNLYYDYMNAKKQLELTTKMAQERRERFELAQKNNVAREILVITDSYYRTAVDRQRATRAEFLAKRAALEQFVGNETFHQFEEELVKREASEKEGTTSSVSSTAKTVAAQNDDYNKTIKGVENYTNNLNNKTAQNEDAMANSADGQNDENMLATNTNASSDDTMAAEENGKKEKEKKEKKDPHDLKGLIFVHDNQPDAANYQDSGTSSKVTNSDDNASQETKKQKRGRKARKEAEQSVNTQASKTELKPLQHAVQTKPKTEKFNGVELMPLDDIKSPDLKPNGYSIFAE